MESEFARLGIPVYIDRTRGIILNPMIEYIKSGLELYKEDFSYEAVFHYLRSGLSDITPEEADLLENYVLATGLGVTKDGADFLPVKVRAWGKQKRRFFASTVSGKS